MDSKNKNLILRQSVLILFLLSSNSSKCSDICTEAILSDIVEQIRSPHLTRKTFMPRVKKKKRVKQKSCLLRLPDEILLHLLKFEGVSKSLTGVCRRLEVIRQDRDLPSIYMINKKNSFYEYLKIIDKDCIYQRQHIFLRFVPDQQILYELNTRYEKIIMVQGLGEVIGVVARYIRYKALRGRFYEQSA